MARLMKVRIEGLSHIPETYTIRIPNAEDTKTKPVVDTGLEGFMAINGNDGQTLMVHRSRIISIHTTQEA